MWSTRAVRAATLQRTRPNTEARSARAARHRKCCSSSERRVQRECAIVCLTGLAYSAGPVSAGARLSRFGPTSVITALRAGCSRSKSPTAHASMRATSRCTSSWQCTRCAMRHPMARLSAPLSCSPSHALRGLPALYIGSATHRKANGCVKRAQRPFCAAKAAVNAANAANRSCTIASGLHCDSIVHRTAAAVLHGSAAYKPLSIAFAPRRAAGQRSALTGSTSFCTAMKQAARSCCAPSNLASTQRSTASVLTAVALCVAQQLQPSPRFSAFRSQWLQPCLNPVHHWLYLGRDSILLQWRGRCRAVCSSCCAKSTTLV